MSVHALALRFLNKAKPQSLQAEDRVRQPRRDGDAWPLCGPGGSVWTEPARGQLVGETCVWEERYAFSIPK